MTQHTENWVEMDMNDPNPGRINPERMANPDPDDPEERPVVTAEDIAETLKWIAIERARKAARTIA